MPHFLLQRCYCHEAKDQCEDRWRFGVAAGVGGFGLLRKERTCILPFTWRHNGNTSTAWYVRVFFFLPSRDYHSMSPYENDSSAPLRPFVSDVIPLSYLANGDSPGLDPECPMPSWLAVTFMSWKRAFVLHNTRGVGGGGMRFASDRSNNRLENQVMTFMCDHVHSSSECCVDHLNSSRSYFMSS